MPSSFVIARDGGKTVCIGQCNFGIPGGLGAASLVQYAKQTYGVTLTQLAAGEFRNKLITQVYPELGLYLSEDSVTVLAKSLQVDAREVRQVWPVVRGWKGNRLAAFWVAGSAVAR